MGSEMCIRDRFYISMDNVVLVKISQSKKNAANDKFGLFLRKTSSLSDVVSHVTTWEVFHKEVQVLSVLHGVDHVDKEIIL